MGSTEQKTKIRAIVRLPGHSEPLIVEAPSRAYVTMLVEFLRSAVIYGEKKTLADLIRVFPLDD